MNEAGLCKELGKLTKDKARWEESIPCASSLLFHESVRIRAKALWLLGEMGLAHPESIHDTIPAIAAFLDSPEPLLRERAANALGRIGRADFQAIEPYWQKKLTFESWHGVYARIPDVRSNMKANGSLRSLKSIGSV